MHTITIGRYYKAKVSGNIVTVRVDEIAYKPTSTCKGPDAYYHVTNLKTGRKATFSSAQKFISERI